MPPRKKKSAEAQSAAAAPEQNGVMEFVKRLWQSAVTLRASIEPADYKRYVLPLIFLRFLSLKYDKRRAEIEAAVLDPKSDLYKYPKACEDEDEYRRTGAFLIPKKARWSEILKYAQADDIKVRVDNAFEELENAYPEKLRGLFPKVFAGSNLPRESVTALINEFSKDVFSLDHGGEDLVGRVYEYFIGEFASSEGKRGGEYFTPASIVRLLVAMVEPTKGTVYDPCCGSGGMFVQSDAFTKHNHQLSFFGQESKDFTYRLCRMNLFIHGLDGDVRLGNTYTDDKHAGLKADYILANPPFNDGSKGEHGWGADRIPDKDPRLVVGGKKIPLAPRNANPMWMMHMLHHLKEGGSAGFVMATGELSNGNAGRLDVRKALVDFDYVDCIVQLSGQLFANTQIPCGLWFLSKSRKGGGGMRKRTGEMLFIDGRKLGALIPGSRKQKQLSEEELEKIAAVYREFKTTGKPKEEPGFCRVATVAEVRDHKYALTPGRYVGSVDVEDDEDFEEKMPRLVKQLDEQLKKSAELEKDIRAALKEVGFGR